MSREITRCATCAVDLLPPYWVHGVEGPDSQPQSQTWSLCTRCHDLLAGRDLDQLVNHIALTTFLRTPALAAGPAEDQNRVVTQAQAVVTMLSACLDAGELVNFPPSAG